MKTISILGSTGSIGRQALEVIDGLSGKFNIHALCAGNNIELLKEQIKKYNPKKVCVKNAEDVKDLQSKFPNIEFFFGDEGLIEIAQDGTNELVLIAVSGIAGLYPTLAAINTGTDIALANKETLVVAGEIVMQRAKQKGVKIIPVDSEHSAIFQCIKGNTWDFSQVKKLILTASGGPFKDKSPEEIANATVKEALSHPRWDMGKKITIDSSTLMNKGLEVIEAHHLFEIKYDDIEVVIHPQSIMHGAVEYKDGSVLTQMGLPSMHIPIQYALCYPEKSEGIKTNSFDFTQVQNLTFEKPDFEKFPCLKLAYEAGKKGGILPATLNGANEALVEAFLEEKISLCNIPKFIEKVLSKCQNIKNPTLSDVIEADSKAREEIKKLIP